MSFLLPRFPGLRLLASVSLLTAPFLGLGCAGGGETPPIGVECANDEDCEDDGVFCNGGVACEAGACVDVNPPDCDDSTACTRDTCVPTTDACESLPIDSVCPEGTICQAGEGCVVPAACEFADTCGDGLFCNGVEDCVDSACVSPGLVDCDDENSCTLDSCVESMSSCVAELVEHLTDVTACGATGDNDCIVCPVPPEEGNALADCTDGLCGFICEEGWFDLDGDPDNFCEYECVPGVEADVPDDDFADVDCDGFDGDVTGAVFLDSTGDDANDGLTPITPVRTFDRAFDLTGDALRNEIWVAIGSYGTDRRLQVPDGVGIYGGYSEAFADRDNTRPTLVSSASGALLVSGLSRATVIDHVNVTTDDRTTGGTVAILVRNSGDFFTFRQGVITAGRGGDGTIGASGGPGAPGATGVNGSGSLGGGGGSVGGGAGRTGRRRNSGLAGTAGQANGSACGGFAGPGSGTGGLGCADGDAGPGGDGGTGCAGNTGSHGSGGNGLGSLTSFGWSASNGGGNGAGGGTGGGGGGGGAGGGEDCSPIGCSAGYCGTGRGGGGGGGGGRGGFGGRGGGGGGASIGFLLHESTVTLELAVVITTGGGGGGRGGSAGSGGTGRGGGTGAVSTSSSDGRGGNGGSGGSGGRGGCGGGGGGGPSVGVWGNTGARLRTRGAVVYMPGPAGAGGSGCGLAGSSGTIAERRSVILL